MIQEALAALAQALAFQFAQQFGVARDVPQGGAQVVGNTVGKRFEFLVRTAQVTRQLGQFFCFTQDDAKHGGAQFQYALDHQRVPRLAVAAQFFLPAFETVPRVEVALRPDLLDRLARPVHRAHLLWPEPQQVVRVDLRDGHRQYAAGMGSELGQVSDVAAHVVTVEYSVFAALAKPVHQRGHLGFRRRLADQVTAFGRDDGGAWASAKAATPGAGYAGHH